MGNPGPEHTVGPAPHLKNPLGESNEIGVDFRRLLPGAEVLDEFQPHAVHLATDGDRVKCSTPNLAVLLHTSPSIITPYHDDAY